MRSVYLIIIICLSNLTVYAQLTVNEDSLSNSWLKDTVELEEVLITAKSKNIDSRGLGNMQINMQQLKVSPLFLGERDLIKTLQFLPGISGGMEGSSQLNIRGGTNDQTQYLMDGIPVYNQNHTFGLFSIFNSDAIKSADVYKGGIPAEFGDKLSGVVSVNLKDGDYQKYHNSISLGILAMTLASEGPLLKDRLSYMFTGRRSLIDLLFNGAMNLAGESSGGGMVSFNDLNGKLAWKINPKNKLFWQIYSGLDDLFGMNKSMDDYLDEKFSERYGYGWKTFMTSLGFQSFMNSNMNLSSNIYYTKLTNFDYYRMKQTSPGFKIKSENGHASQLKEIGSKASIKHLIGDENTLSYGIEGVYSAFKPDYLYQTINKHYHEYNNDHLSLFKISGHIYNELRIKRLFLSFGLRSSLFNNTHRSKFVLEPRVKVNTYIFEKNKLMMAYDRMYQPVHTVNEMNYSVATDFWLPFQEDLLANSHQLSLGWKNYTTSNLSFSVEAYYKLMNNLLLIRDLENYIDFHSGYEKGSGNSMGIELMVQYSKEKFTAWASYTISSSQRTFLGKTYPFKYDAPNSLSGFASYIINPNNSNKHTLSFNIQYQTGYPYYVSEISYPGMGLPTNPSGYIEFHNIATTDYIPSYPNIRLKDFFRIDVNYSIEKKLKHGNLIWQFSILNLTNRQNPYAVYKKDDKYKAFILIPLMPSVSIKREF